MNGALEQRVRERAYEIWMDLGLEHGHAHDHWIAAEREIMAQPARSAVEEVAASTAKATKPRASKPKAASQGAKPKAASAKAPAKAAKPAARVRYPDSPASSAHSR